jgi:hypothetical protein
MLIGKNATDANMAKFFKLGIENLGQGYIRPAHLTGGSQAFFAAAAGPEEFSAHIDALIEDLETLRQEGTKALKDRHLKFVRRGRS